MSILFSKTEIIKMLLIAPPTYHEIAIFSHCRNGIFSNLPESPQFSRRCFAVSRFVLGLSRLIIV